MLVYVGFVFVKFAVRKINNPLNVCGDFKTWDRSQHYFRTELAPGRPL